MTNKLTKSVVLVDYENRDVFKLYYDSIMILCERFQKEYTNT